MDLTSGPSFLPRGQRQDWKFQPSDHPVGFPGNQSSSVGYPGAFQIHLINITKDTFITFVARIPKVLEALYHK